MVNTLRFTQFLSASLSSTTNKIVGASAASGGDNIIFNFPITWTNASRPVTAANGMLGYNTDTQFYEYWNNDLLMWVQLITNGGSEFLPLSGGTMTGDL